MIRKMAIVGKSCINKIVIGTAGIAISRKKKSTKNYSPHELFKKKKRKKRDTPYLFDHRKYFHMDHLTLSRLLKRIKTDRRRKKIWEKCTSHTARLIDCKTPVIDLRFWQTFHFSVSFARVSLENYHLLWEKKMLNELLLIEFTRVLRNSGPPKPFFFRFVVTSSLWPLQNQICMNRGH